jgi:glycosyltransferase involved in cell wall biosynthesis
MSSLISLIIATYNWPEALNLCLQSLRLQTDSDFEVIIADDGSTLATRKVVDEIGAFPVSIRYCWHEDDGCRKTIICNQAMREARGGYFIFLDADCLVQPDFVARHRALAKKGHMVTGSRVLLSEALTAKILREGAWDFRSFLKRFPFLRLQEDVNKILPIFLKLGDADWRNYREFVWRRIKGCNMACWREDALAIGGYDETLLGWSHEDADFVFRLQNAGVIRKDGAFSTEVFHLYHRVRDQSNDAESKERLNKKIREMKSAKSKISRSLKAIGRYRSEDRDLSARHDEYLPSEW